MWFPALMALLTVYLFGSKQINKQIRELKPHDMRSEMKEWQDSAFRLRPCIGAHDPTCEKK